MTNTVGYSISWWKLVARSLRWHWRLHLATAVALAIAVATLAGALCIGWSLQKSLESALVARLGGVESAVMLQQPAGEGAAQRLAGDGSEVAGMLELPGVMLNEGQGAAVPGRVWAVEGTGPALWRMPELGAGEVAVNAALARDCGLRVGDWVVVRADTSVLRPEMGLFTFRRASETSRVLRLQVKAVVPAGTWGDFTLGQSQVTPRNAFVRLDAIAGAGVNRIVSGRDVEGWRVTSSAVQLADLGLRLRSVPGMQLLQSRAVALTDQQLAALRSMSQRTLCTHIAEEIRSDGGVVSYGVIVSDSGEQLGEEDVVLNEVVAKQLGVKAGERLRMSVLLSAADGSFGRSELAMRVARVEPTGAGLFVPGVTTEIEGMTNAQRMDAWKTPFPVDQSKISGEDERYWEQYRTTPKAIISDALMQRLWRESGFVGERAATAVVFDGGADSLGGRIVEKVVGGDPQWRPVDLVTRARTAGQGSSDFAGLFVAMSGFMVIGAMLLAIGVARTAIESRLGELGVAEALGLNRAQWQRWAMLEQCFVAVPAAIFGALLGVAYAAAMLRLFDALGGGVWEMPPIVLDARWVVLVVVGLAVAAVVLLVTWWQVRREMRRPVRELLGSVQEMTGGKAGRKHGWGWIVGGAAVAAAALVLSRMGKLDSATGFFLAAVGVLVACWAGLRSAGAAGPRRAATGWVLGVRIALSQRRRMMLTFAVFAAASLVLCSVALYRAGGVRVDVHDRRSATGGFALQLSLPVISRTDLANSEQLRRAGAADGWPADVKAYGLAMSQGTEGGCLNLARPAEMQVLGVSPTLVARDGFDVRPEHEVANPWTLLEQGGDAVPVFGDEETMQWIEHRSIGDVFEMPVGGRPVKLRLAGVVRGGLFSGQLLMAEASFRRLLPERAGYGMYLVEGGDEQIAAVRKVLRPLLEDGAILEGTDRIIARVASVQQLYMTMFLVLGGLGLVLGGAGVLAVVARDAVQRRGELAMMQAAGVGTGRVAGLLALGHVLPVACGLVAGCVAACVGYVATGLAVPVIAAGAIPAGLAVVVGVLAFAVARAMVPTQIGEVLRGEA